MTSIQATKAQFFQQSNSVADTFIESHNRLWKRKLTIVKILNIAPLYIGVFCACGHEPINPLWANKILNQRAFLLDNRFRPSKPDIELIDHVGSRSMVRDSANEVTFSCGAFTPPEEKIICKGSNDSTNQPRNDKSKNINHGWDESIRC